MPQESSCGFSRRDCKPGRSHMRPGVKCRATTSLMMRKSNLYERQEFTRALAQISAG